MPTSIAALPIVNQEYKENPNSLPFTSSSNTHTDMQKAKNNAPVSRRPAMKEYRSKNGLTKSAITIKTATGRKKIDQTIDSTDIYIFLIISSATCSLPLGTYTIKGLF